MQDDQLRRDGFNPMLSFGLSSEHCELLLALEAAGTLAQLAKMVGRDASVISRQLQRLCETAPVLEKQQGKWRLSNLGKQINNWTREAATAQKLILHQQTLLRIASTREFASRVLSPKLSELQGEEKNTLLSVLTSESGIEHLLLSGQADLGFDCGRPDDPLVRFERVKDEPFAVVVSPSFSKTHKIKSQKELLKLPHLQYKRASAPRLLQLSYDVPHVLATFNDIACIREACRAGLGWAVLPFYAVKREIEYGTLIKLPGWKIDNEQFGVWWIRGRTSIDVWVERAIQWLKRQQLS